MQKLVCRPTTGNPDYDQGYSGFPKVSSTIINQINSRTVAATAERKTKFSNGTMNFAYGALDQANTLEFLRIWQGTVAQYGIDRLTEQIAILMEATNAIVGDMIQNLAIIGSERYIRNGAVDQVTMVQLDTAGIPLAQKVFVVGSPMGMRLNRYGIGLEWNMEYWRQKDMRQFANEMQSIITADANRIKGSMINALFQPSNELTFLDVLQDYLILPVRALVNADGTAIPPNPYGYTFNNSTHTHYMYPGGGNGDTVATYSSGAWSSSTVAQKALDLQAIEYNMKEHYNDGTMVIYTSPSDSSNWLPQNGSATQIPGFLKLDYVYSIPSITRDVDTEGRLDTQDFYDRFLGHFDGIQVWTKPWVPAGYIFAFFVDKPKPLYCRVPLSPDKATPGGVTPTGSLTLGGGDLRMINQWSSHPLTAQAMVRDFGFSAWERTNGICFDMQGTSAYVAPAIQ